MHSPQSLVVNVHQNPFTYLNKPYIFRSTTSVPKCRVCKARHFLKSCPAFQRMTVMERREVIKDKGFCFNCLCTAHTRNFCPSRKKCLVCERNHHTMIHLDETSHASPSQQHGTSNRSGQRSTGNSRRTSAQQTRSETPSPERGPTTSQRRRSALSVSTNTTSPSKSHMKERLSRRSRTHVFLPTALARVLTAHGPEKVRLLLNCGEAQTVFLRRLVDRLGLHTSKRDNKEFCTLNLQSYHDPTAKIQVVGLVQSHFKNTVPKSTTEIKLQSVYDHLTELADPHFFQPNNIEIILANDQLPRILRAGFIQTSSTMPIAQSTMFGWTISGACQY